MCDHVATNNQLPVDATVNTLLVVAAVVVANVLFAGG